MPFVSGAFSPIASLAGSLVIGATSSAKLLSEGRVLGISGIVNGVLDSRVRDRAWRTSFVGGLIGGGAVLATQAPEVFGAIGDAATSTDQLTAGAVAGSGFLVGLGTQMGSGCTSGHGVCGLPRLSKRSFVAVSTFMGTGSLAAMAKNHVAAVHDWTFVAAGSEAHSLMATMVPNGPAVAALASAGLLARAFVQHRREREEARLACRRLGCSEAELGAEQPDPAVVLATGYGSGAVFAGGLGMAGMLDTAKVTAFLDPVGEWDPSLAMVMGGAVAFNLPAFHAILRRSKPLLREAWSVPTRSAVNAPLLVGSALFGLGWGLGGLCPGPGVVAVSTGAASFYVWGLSLLAGMKASHMLSEAASKA